MARLVSEDATSIWSLKTHGLMKDVPCLQDGKDQQIHRPGLLATACLLPRC